MVRIFLSPYEEIKGPRLKVIHQHVLFIGQLILKGNAFAHLITPPQKTTTKTGPVGYSHAFLGHICQTCKHDATLADRKGKLVTQRFIDGLQDNVVFQDLG